MASTTEQAGVVTVEFPEFDCSHEFPSDWVFGGANGKHPGADARYQPHAYTWIDEELNEIWHSSAPICLHAALEEFTRWRDFCVQQGLPMPQYIKMDGNLLPWTYDAETDVVTEHRG